MKKAFLNSFVLFVLFSLTPKLSGQIIFQEDFDGIGGGSAPGNYPFSSGWFLRNVDNKTPDPTVSFVNDAWERVEDFDNPSDSCAYSTSWYSPAGIANDFMWTPAIVLPTGSINLSWEGKATDPNFADGYQVRIMTVAPTGSNGVIGNQLTNSVQLLSVAAENTTWTNRSVSLNAYAGQTVYIGFRNNSNDKNLLVIDDIIVEKLIPIDAKLDSIGFPSEYFSMPVTQRTPLNFVGKIKNNGTSALNTVKLKVNVFDFNDNLITTLTSPSIASLAPGSSSVFTVTPYTLPNSVEVYYFQLYANHSVADGKTDNDSLYFALPILVDDSIYSREDGSITGTLGIGAGNGGYLGNQFKVQNNGSISSISIGLGTVDVDTKLALAVWNMLNGKPNIIIGRTDTIILTSTSDNFITLPIKGGPLSVTPGEYVVTAIEVDSTLPIGRTGYILTEGKTWIDWPTNPNGDWSNTEDFGPTFFTTFIIRPNFGCTPVAASVSIATTTTTVCASTNVTFTATPTNGGPAPSYQWKLNGNNVGTNSATYSNNALANGNTVTCVMTSNADCVTGSPATSNTITMTVNPSVAASVNIAPTATNICAGTNVTFTATPTNGGATPVYQWKLNGVNVGTNSPTYSNNTLTNLVPVTCVMTSNAACVTGSPATSNSVAIVVNPSVAASVSIAPTATNVCAGTNVTFTATPTNGGAAPSYQWKLNGNNVGTNSSTYSNNTLANGNLVSCVMTSNAACVTGSPATSNTINMTVNTNLTPTVAISANANPICPGTNVTFTATPSNGGTTPSYQWKLNGNNVGTNSATYSNAALATGNTVSCVMTSNASCLTSSTATSNVITMQVTANPPASVTIAPTATNICAGTNVTFTATPINGGTPSYQWKLNGNNVGTNSATYSNNALTNGNTVTCIMTSSLSCVTGSPANSNTITMTVNPNVAASVSIVPTATNVCSGTNVTFTATPTNGGTTPSYQWKLNGANVGTNSPTYSNNALANLVPVTCVMTSNAACVTGSPANSNSVAIIVNPSVAASVSIAPTATNVCAGTNVTFTATPTNGGAAPSYQWKLNGGNVGTNSATYSNNALANGNTVSCVMTSNAACVTGSPATSNTINMTVNPNPVPIISQTVNNLNSSAAASYQWNLNGNPIALNGTSQQYTALVNGNYSVTVVDANGCTGTSAVLNVTVSGIFQPVQFQKIEIFPNPNNGLMKMVIETPKGGEITLQIIDILGKLVSEKIVNINQGRNEFALDLSELSQNIYFIKTKLNDLNYQGKIIIAE